jgi:hypothetical protein
VKKFSGIQLVALAALGLLWVFCAYHLVTEDKQWDFRTYYYAAEAQQRHLDAYNVDILSQLAGEKLTLSYVYPPLTLWFFRLFKLVDFSVASQGFLILKFILLAALIVLWMKYFLEGEDLVLFLWFATLAFSSTIYWDLVAGNIGLIEQALFWGAILALMRRRLAIFTAAIVLISFFKFTHIVFLGLPLLVWKRPALKYTLVGVACFLLYLYANHYFAADDFNSFLSVAANLDERGEVYNHALLPFLRDCFDRAVLADLLPPLPRLVPDLLYVGTVVGLLAITWRAYRRRPRQELDRNGMLEMIFLACITYAVVMPRMKSYSFVLLIPPAYYVLRKCLKAEAFIFVFILLSLTKWTPLPVPDFVRFLWWYYPWLCALMIWVLYLRYLREPAARS